MKTMNTILTMVMLHACFTSGAQDIKHATIKVAGKDRSYILYTPQHLPDNSPLVFVIHGYTDNAENMMNETKMNEVADKYKFAVCYPQGLNDHENKSYWEVGYSFTQNLHNDDVKFLTTLAGKLQAAYKLSRKNTFATGMSNGADMCIMLACKSKNVFKAFAPVCGSLMKLVFDASKEIQPVPVFMINSTSDKITWWEGDMVDKQGYGAYLPVLGTFDFFVKKNACTKLTLDTLANTNEADGSFVVSEKHTNGTNGNQVWLYKVVNGGHQWPGASGNMDINASDEVWKFFEQFVTRF